MNKRWLLACVTFAAAGLSGTATVKAVKPSPFVEVSVIVSFQNAPADGVKSDGGAYTDGQQNVRAVLLANSNGNFVFDTNDGNGDGGRRLYLDFNGQTTPFLSATPIPIDVFLGTLAINGGDPSDNLQFMHVGQTLQRRARWAWVEGAVQYSLRWDGPENDYHSFLNVLCDVDDGAVSPTHCTKWTVTPGGIAGLYSFPAKGKEIDTYYGRVTMPFAMTLIKK